MVVIEIRFGNKEYILFGRKPKVPEKKTSTLYIDNGFSRGGLSNLMSKEMSADALRRFAKMPVCRRAISLVKNGLLNLEWTVEKRDVNDTTDYTQEIERISRCIRNPNYKDSFRSLFGSAIEDILTGDCGAIEIRESYGDKPVWLYPVDGFTIKLRAEYIKTPDDIAFEQTRLDGSTINLKDKELMYFKLNEFTNTPLGLSPLESAFCIVNYLLETQKYAGLVASSAIPKKALNLGEQCDENTLVKFRKYFEEEVYGSGRTPILGGSKGINSVDLSASSDDGLFLEWQHFLTVIVAYTFGIDPKRFNEGSQTDRSTVDEQSENMMKEAIKPLANVIEEQINKKIIGLLGYNDKLVFKFRFEDSEPRKKQMSDRLMAEFNADILTLDEVRQRLGYAPIGGEYGEMLKSEYKVALNTKYAKETAELNNNTGGYNGVGKNRYDGGDGSSE